MTEETNICPICKDELEEGSTCMFVEIPMCSRCHDDLGLEDLVVEGPDPVIDSLVDEKGKEILSRTTALIRGQPSYHGWKLLAMAPLIKEQMEEGPSRLIVISGLILTGNAMVRNGLEEREDELDDRLVSLLIMVGQYLDLSVMGRIAIEKGLKKNDILDELALREEHDHRLFGLLSSMVPGEDEEKRAILANAMSLLISS